MRSGFNQHQIGAGFTLIETIVAVSLLFLALSFFYVNFTRLPSTTNQSLAVTKLISDIKYAQAQSMSGVQTSIDLIQYANTLDDGLDLSTTFSGSTITFQTGSGDIANYVQGQDSVSILNTITNQTATINLNKYASTY